MSLSHPHLHRACYDSNGNIVILSDDKQNNNSDTVLSAASPIQETGNANTFALPEPVMTGGWTTTVEEPWHAPPVLDESIAAETQFPPVLHSIARQTHGWISRTIRESKNQYRAAADSGTGTVHQSLEYFRQFPSQAQTFLVRSAAIAARPVTIGKRKKTKPRGKLSLFLIDTVRFGGTFALIFVTLFVGINYQSFWQIAKADLALGNDLQTQHALADIIGQKTGVSALAASHLSFAQANDSLLAHLPPVGPPSNRIIIPSLGINAPVVEPKVDALIAQNWVQFEKDVQASLLLGVVHYPGSARPGQTGNVFMTGHSSFYPGVASAYKDVFATLGNIRIGDTYSLYYRGDLHQYRVTQKMEVSPNNVSVLDQPLDKRISTLMTCTPVGTTLRRLIVQAEEIDPVSGEVLKIGQRPADQQTSPVRPEQLPV